MDPDLKTTLREFKEYVALSYESPGEIAARVGVAQKTIWDWLSGRSQPKAPSLPKLRRFLDNEAKRPVQGDGIRPIECLPFKIIKPIQQVRYARLCPFCRKAHGEILQAAHRICSRAFARSAERADRRAREPSGSAHSSSISSTQTSAILSSSSGDTICPRPLTFVRMTRSP